MTDKYRLWQGGQARMIHSKLSNFNTEANDREASKPTRAKYTWGSVAGKAIFQFNRVFPKLPSIADTLGICDVRRQSES
jgi:hypothetical protein